jgi:hypothetical protein
MMALELQKDCSIDVVSMPDELTTSSDGWLFVGSNCSPNKVLMLLPANSIARGVPKFKPTHEENRKNITQN